MTKFYLSDRFEEPSEHCNRYDNNNKVNDEIARAFKESVADFDENEYKENIPNVTKEDMLVASDFKGVPYGSSTLEKSGCAVFCFWQGLCSRDVFISMDMETFAKYIYDKGYYKFGTGTYHNLFDHYGLRRATHFQEIFDALQMKKIVTILVENKKYTSNKFSEDSHFVNIIGKMKQFFVIYDSQIGITYVPMKKTFDATRVVWIW